MIWNKRHICYNILLNNPQEQIQEQQQHKQSASVVVSKSTVCYF